MLLLIFGLSSLAYCYYNRTEDGLFSFLIVISFLFIIRQEWYISALSISLLIYSILFVKRTSYEQMMVFSIVGAIIFGYFLFNFFIYNFVKHTSILLFSAIILMCYLSIKGIFEDDLEKYLIISNFIQVLFMFLYLLATNVQGKLLPLGIIQIFNYTFSGTLLFLTIGVLSKDNRRIKVSQLRGSIYRNPFVTFCAIVALLSLAGLPGLNMFYGRWLLIKDAYLISPVTTALLIFLIVLILVMYFKIIYVLSSGESKVIEKTPFLINLVIILFLLTSIILGIPTVQEYLLGLI
ncbi:MAG: proton-conducting transporter membrane subunit [Candidatus Aenigmatarchaeota archaeon]